MTNSATPKSSKHKDYTPKAEHPYPTLVMSASRPSFKSLAHNSCSPGTWLSHPPICCTRLLSEYPFFEYLPKRFRNHSPRSSWRWYSLANNKLRISSRFACRLLVPATRHLPLHSHVIPSFPICTKGSLWTTTLDSLDRAEAGTG